MKFIGLVVTALCVAGTLATASHQERAKDQPSSEIELLQSAECLNAVSLLNINSCTVQIVNRFTGNDPVATIQEARDIAATNCPSCNVTEYEARIASVENLCVRGDRLFPQPELAVRRARAVTLMCGDDPAAECFVDAFFYEEQNEPESQDASCQLECYTDYYQITQDLSEQCGNITASRLCLRDSTTGDLCSRIQQRVILNIRDLYPTYCATECDENVVPLIAGQLENDCVLPAQRGCNNQFAVCARDPNATTDDLCFTQQSEVFPPPPGESRFLGGRPQALLSALTRACQVDTLDGRAICDEGCRDFITNHTSIFGCCFLSLVDVCTSVDDVNSAINLVINECGFEEGDLPAECPIEGLTAPNPGQTNTTTGGTTTQEPTTTETDPGNVVPTPAPAPDENVNAASSLSASLSILAIVAALVVAQAA